MIRISAAVNDDDDDDEDGDNDTDNDDDGDFEDDDDIIEKGRRRYDDNGDDKRSYEQSP